jgi:hypothetical protein
VPYISADPLNIEADNTPNVPLNVIFPETASVEYAVNPDRVVIAPYTSTLPLRVDADSTPNVPLNVLFPETANVEYAVNPDRAVATPYTSIVPDKVVVPETPNVPFILVAAKEHVPPVAIKLLLTLKFPCALSVPWIYAALLQVNEPLIIAF